MATAFDKNERFYKQVPASSSEQYDYVPANGEKLRIINVGVSSSSIPDTTACIAWDAAGTPDIIISSYGEAKHQDIIKDVVGDGIKILRINLTNDLTEPTYMGGFWQGIIL